MPRCKYCSEKYTPARSMQPGSVCNSVECQAKHAMQIIEKQRKSREKAEDIAAREDRKVVRMKLEELKTPHQKRSKLIQKVEKSTRDVRRTEELLKGRGCISCNRSQQEVIQTDGWKPGGAFDAGHFCSKGARPNLRFEPDNIWLQCKSCNAGSAKYARKGATVAKQYRENLILLIGLARVEELEADVTPRHWTDEELIVMHKANLAKLKEMKRVQ